MREKCVAICSIFMFLIAACGYKAPPPGKPELKGPSIEIVSPSQRDTVSDTVQVVVNVSDPSGVAIVLLLVDGTEVVRDSVEPYELRFDTSQFFDGEHQILVKASDRWDNWSTSKPLTLIFKNGKVERHENKRDTGR